jgi:hypothetical protein
MEENKQSSKKSSENFLEKFEEAIEKMEPTSDEEHKITIMITTIAHGEKIILRERIANVEEFEDYELELKSQPWYTFVEKTYIYGYAPFGNACLMSNNPAFAWSRASTKRGLEQTFSTIPIDTKSRKAFAKTAKKLNTSFITNSVLEPETSIPQKRGVIMAKIVKTEKDLIKENFPTKGIMNPMKLRLEIVPSVYGLSGKNTDKLEESLKDNPDSFIASDDKYSGIFVSILSDNKGNTFKFPSLFNLADGKHISEIFTRLEEPISDLNSNVDGKELYKVIGTYITYWNEFINPRIQEGHHNRNQILSISLEMKIYYVQDTQTKKPKTVNYFILTQMNTMNVYVFANLVFDFLLSKKNNPNTPYTKTKDELILWLEELKGDNSKIINISTACEGVNPAKMDEGTIQDVAAHINDNSLRRNTTQNNSEEEEGGPDLIHFDELDEYISQLEVNAEAEAKGLRKGKKHITRKNKRRNTKKYKRKNYKKTSKRIKKY